MSPFVNKSKSGYKNTLEEIGDSSLPKLPNLKGKSHTQSD